MNRLSVIIVAAGKGLRMGAELPKQFLSFSSRPILMLTIEKFAQTLPDVEIIVALSADYVDFWKRMCDEQNFNIPHTIVLGGDTRFESVRNCVDSLCADSQYVLVHDGVRPFVSSELINRVLVAVKKYGAVVPAVDVIDSLRRVVGVESSIAVARENLKSVQTPQAFEKKLLLKSYNKPFSPSFTDDASVVEADGYEVAIVEGERRNIKITTMEDFFYGNFLLKQIKIKKIDISL